MWLVETVEIGGLADYLNNLPEPREVFFVLPAEKGFFHVVTYDGTMLTFDSSIGGEQSTMRLA